MGSTRSTAGSANAARSPRSVTRESRTATLMENIMTGGEVSKKREAELQKAANYGRGVKFVEASPTVKGLTQKGGKPVYRTGVTAQDFTGRITANEPTLRELGGDIARGLVGGQAPDPGYTGEFSQYTPKPQKVKGLIPTVIDAAISGSLSPVGAIMKGVSSSGFFSYGNGKDSGTTATTAPETTTEFAESEAEANRKKKLAGSLVSSATKGRSLFSTKARTISGGMA
jgi:hypothetical protein